MTGELSSHSRSRPGVDSNSPAFLHPLADVHGALVGDGSRLWQYVVVLPGAKIGRDCNICAHVLIEGRATVGDRVTVKSGVQLWDGVVLGDDVFVGPNVSFSNDRFPRSRQIPDSRPSTVVARGASIGAGATILPGVTIGEEAFVGAGAVVTRSVPPYAIVVGNPARVKGYVETAPWREKSTSALPSVSKSLPSRVRGVALIRLPLNADIRGSLAVGELSSIVPFDIQRFFLVFDVPSAETRGEHAHRACHQLLICVNGSLEVVVDDGQRRESFTLNTPDLALHLPPMIWGIQHKFSPGAVLLVLASHAYDPGDYIRNYGDFRELVTSGGAGNASD